MVQVEFGKKVQEIRKSKGISQEKFALSIGIDRTYLASLEAGKRNVSLCNIKKIADGFGMTISQLFEGIK